MVKEASRKILRQGFVFRLLPREKLKILIVMRLYSCNHAPKDDRKTVCRTRKDRVSVVSCYGFPLYDPAIYSRGSGCSGA